jgi:hypothetical protein
VGGLVTDLHTVFFKVINLIKIQPIYTAMHIIMNDKRKYEVSPVLTFIIAYLPEEDLYYIRVIILKHT